MLLLTGEQVEEMIRLLGLTDRATPGFVGELGRKLFLELELGIRPARRNFFDNRDVFKGSSLVKLGRAHCKVATLQEAFALTLRDTSTTFLLRFGEEIKEYDAIRKKLESKRLSYNAAIAKSEKFKNSKKEKDRREAEEELERAQYRYEEALEDVHAYMHAIQENEIAQHRELTAFLDMEVNYVHSILTR
ncbi:hypothetical protein F5887DRAFT_90505 [Amanita rubescens]|nr:hypothetical protein F5887DRAFT_90505 [Amanita rubescens]